MLGVGVEFGTPLDEVAHIIRLALTPVFFLLSIAALLNVFSARLALVGDRVEQVTKVLETADKDHAAALQKQLIHLHRRTFALDGAVILASVAKAAICASVLLLFLGTLGDEPVGWALLIAFGSAVICALGAILAFAIEMLLAGTGIRLHLEHGHRRHLLHLSLGHPHDT
jgi:hypothetical protein